MANFLQNLAAAAQHKAAQVYHTAVNDVSHTVAPAVTHIAGQAAYDATHNPVTNVIGHNVVQPAIHFMEGGGLIGMQHPGYQQFSRGVSHGLERSAIGTGQAISGLYDLAGGQHSTSRVDKFLDHQAKGIDNIAHQQHVNPLLYKGSQAAGDALQMALGGGEVKLAGRALTELPKAGGAFKAAGKGLALTEKPAQAIARATKDGNFIQRVGGKTAANVLSPKYQAANAVFTAGQEGKNASHGLPVTARSAATDLAMGGLAFPAAGAVGSEVLAPVARAAAPLIKDGAKVGSKAYASGKSKLTANDAIAQEIATRKSAIQSLQQRQAKTAIGSVASENHQRAIDIHQAAIDKLQAGRQKLTISERLMNQQVGNTVGGPNALKYQLAKKQGRVFDGVDGKPRFEIDDSGSRLANPHGSTLGEVLDHPQLYDQYPALKDIPVVAEKSTDKRGSFDGTTLRLNPDNIGNPEELRRTILHEVQHAIQGKEQFAQGGSPGYAFADQAAEITDKLHATGMKLADSYGKNSPLARIRQRQLEARQASLNGKYAQLREKMTSDDPKLIEQYHHLAGEAEARAVENRAYMSADYRAAKPFYDSLDVPKNKLIVRKGGGSALSIDKRAYADDLSPEQNKAIADYAEFLKQVGQGNGVDITADGRRVSNNFRTAENKGKAMTNTHWFDQARSDLESGKADSYAVEDYKQQPGLKQPIAAPKATPAPAQPKPSGKRQLPAPRETGGESSAKPTIPAKPVDTKTYLKQQTQAQETARKAGQATGLNKVKAGVAEVKAKMVDSLSPIEDRLNTKITAENATGHITPQLDRALRADSITGQYIKDNGLAKVIQKVPDTKEFDQYLIAKHAADLEKNGIKTGRNAEADAQLVKDLGGKYEEHAKAIKQYSQGLLDKAVDYGLISKDLAKGLKEKYPNYVPANRIFGDNELVKPPKGIGGGNASIGSQSVVQKIKGSSRAIESPLASIINKTSDVIAQGERNKAAQILTGYKSLPGNPFNLRELKPTETVGEKHVISVLDNGKVRRFETDPAIAAAAKSLNKEQLGLVGKILNAPVRVLRMGATTLNPAFTGANIAKDMVTGAINSKNPVRASVANPTVFLQALKASLNHGSKEYGELVREGAGGTSFDIARDAPKQNVAAIRAQKDAPSKIAYTATHPAQLFRAAENAIGRSEEFTRALQYYGGKQGAKASGASEQASRVLAAHAARNNTTNFARSGDFGKVLNSVIPYLNAGFQGSRTLVRNLGDRPAQTAGKMVVGAFMPVAAATAWNISDPQRKAAYDDIKQYEKQGNIVIVPPNPVKDPNTGKWNVIKIPLSQEVANLGNVVRNGIETGMKDGSFDAKGLVGDLLGTATSLNLQSPRQAFGQVMPQALKVPAEMITNQNLYTGNKIVPDSQKNLDPKDQYGPTTSGTAKTIGKLTGTSPRQIDNAVRTGVGGLGQNIINTSDNALAKLGIIQPTDIKGTSFAKAASNRFNGAQGSNQYDAIDTKTADLTKQLKQLPGYQNMSNTDKAKALSRLTNQITQTYTSKKALTPKQQAIDNGSIKVSDYLAPSTGTGKSITVNNKIDPHSQKVLGVYNSLNADQNKQKAYSEPSWDYKVAQAKYDNAVANGTLSKAQAISQKQAVQKAKVGASFSKDTRDVYNTLSKQEVYNLITTDQNGKKIASDLLAYGDALKSAGIEKNKFRTSKGAESFGDGTNSATKAAKAPAFKAYKSNLGATIKAARGTGLSSNKYKVAKVSLSSKLKGNTAMAKYSTKKLTLNKKA